MSTFKDVVVCKFAGCNQVYNDARILPCGKRTCGYCWKRRFVCMSCGAVHKRMRLAAL